MTLTRPFEICEFICDRTYVVRQSLFFQMLRGILAANSYSAVGSNDGAHDKLDGYNANCGGRFFMNERARARTAR